MARSNGDRLCWDWNPGRSAEVGDTAVSPLDLTQTLSNIPEATLVCPRAPDETLSDLAAPMAAFTIHDGREPLTIDPDVTIGVFAGVGSTPPPGSANLLSPQAKEERIPFPQSGDGIAGFRLLSELGRGAFGRVFLAEESLLGNRLVALKITRAEGDEPRILARLQHTHIVPIHSVHDDPKTGLRVMCMPYFGGANLAQVLEAAAACHDQRDHRSLLKALDIVGLPPPSEAAGKSPSPRRRPAPDPAAAEGSSKASRLNTLVATLTGSKSRAATRPGGAEPAPADPSRSAEALRSSQASPQSRWPFLSQIPWWTRSIGSRSVWPGSEPTATNDRDPVQPARKFLREANFVRAAAWIIARLAEGLEHAHSHGLMHRDLKPSNILIAADGTPMLLDFNLAADSTIKANEEDRVRMGGTLPYMAPEHLDAFHPNGSTRPEQVDERSDIYALGLILFEMIAGNRPFAEPEPHRPLLEMIRIMIDERRAGAPSLRSIDATIPPDLDAVVRKCLDPNPDRRHARAGDLAEDIRRFLDDQPLKYTSEPSLQGRFAKWLRRNPRATGASTVGAVGLSMVLCVGAVAWSVTHHMAQISARLKLKGFEAQFPHCQLWLNTVGGPVESLGRGITLAEETLQQAGISLDPAKDRTSGGWLEVLAPEEQKEVRQDLAEVILLVARARIYLADRTHSPDEQHRAVIRAIAWLDRAETIDPNPTISLYDDRANYLTRAGDPSRAAEDRDRCRKLAPTSGRDFYLLGTSLLAKGEPDRAETTLIKAIGLTPQGFWPWFALGLCHYDQKRFAESAGDFAVCTVLSPKFAWPWMNRGLALARASRLIEARAAYDRALEADGSMADALANRALVALELGDAAAAVADLDRAFALGRREVNLQAARGEALGRAGRTSEALSLLDGLIAANPAETLPRIARGTLRLNFDISGAQEDFHQVLRVAPHNVGALLGLSRSKRLTEPQEALRYATLAQQFDPNRIDAIELSAWLRGWLGQPEVTRDVDRLVQSPTAKRLYNAACSLALYHEHHHDPRLAAQAISYLQRAIKSGIAASQLQRDPDLTSLRANPMFQALVAPTSATPTQPAER